MLNTKNLQNIPSTKEYRAAFTAQKSDWRIVGADYSGMELRLLAELTLDPAFLDIFDKGLDPHATVGSMIYGKTIRAPGTNGPDDPGENMDLRKHAKTLVFGISYGMGPKRLAAATGMSYDEAKNVIKIFWAKFPHVKLFFDRMISYSRKNKCAIAPLDGRLRWLLDIDFDNVKSRVHAENISKNFPLQGGNATITKNALILIREEIKGKQIKIINTVHDEIILEAHESCADEAQKILVRCMVDAAKPYVKRVPIKVESYIANCWKK
jgi:DNA polymerase-1